MNLRSVILIVIAITFVVLVATSCAIFLSLPPLSLSPSNPMAIVVFLSLILMVAGASGIPYLNNIDQSVKRKKGNLLLATNILGIGLFLWGILTSNFIILLVSYPFLILAAMISLSFIPLIQHSSSSDHVLRASNNQKLPASQSVKEAFSDYERVYRTQQQKLTSPVSQEQVQKPEISPRQPEYEQSLVVHPEMPPMQQQ